MTHHRGNVEDPNRRDVERWLHRRFHLQALAHIRFLDSMERIQEMHLKTAGAGGNLPGKFARDAHESHRVSCSFKR